MTRQRIDEIRRRTVIKAIEKIKKVDMANPLNATLEIGIIMGELDNNLERELYHEMNLRKRVYNMTNDSYNRGENNEKVNHDWCKYVNGKTFW